MRAVFGHLFLPNGAVVRASPYFFLCSVAVFFSMPSVQT